MYYKEKEDWAIEAWTEFAVEPLGETPDELREDIRFFMKAFQKPILEEQAKDEKPILVADDNSQQIKEGALLIFQLSLQELVYVFCRQTLHKIFVPMYQSRVHRR